MDKKHMQMILQMKSKKIKMWNINEKETMGDNNVLVSGKKIFYTTWCSSTLGALIWSNNRISARGILSASIFFLDFFWSLYKNTKQFSDNSIATKHKLYLFFWFTVYPQWEHKWLTSQSDGRRDIPWIVAIHIPITYCLNWLAGLLHCITARLHLCTCIHITHSTYHCCDRSPVDRPCDSRSLDLKY